MCWYKYKVYTESQRLQSYTKWILTTKLLMSCRIVNVESGSSSWALGGRRDDAAKVPDGDVKVDVLVAEGAGRID